MIMHVKERAVDRYDDGSSAFHNNRSQRLVASVIDTVVNLAKRRGLVYPAGEIYGGTKSAWDYGPLGVEPRRTSSGSGGARWSPAVTTSSAWTPRSSCRARCGSPRATSRSSTTRWWSV